MEGQVYKTWGDRRSVRYGTVPGSLGRELQWEPGCPVRPDGGTVGRWGSKVDRCGTVAGPLGATDGLGSRSKNACANCPLNTPSALLTLTLRVCASVVCIRLRRCPIEHERLNIIDAPASCVDTAGPVDMHIMSRPAVEKDGARPARYTYTYTYTARI